MTIRRFRHESPQNARRSVAATLLGIGLSAGLVAAPAVPAPVPAGVEATGPAAAAAPRPRPDIDGDRRADVIMGAAGVLAIVDGAGLKHVVPAPSTTDPINNIFATTTATGDFNHDGFDDVAAADGFYQSTAGAVWIFSGGPHGTLIGDGTIPTELIQPGRDGLPGTASSGVFFGNALAAGDLTGDGVDDLAIGAMDQPVASKDLAGTVTIVPGSAGALAPALGRVLSQSTPGVPGVPEYNDKFGAALAIGDVTGDGRLDLAVGSTGENGDGMVQLLPGAAGGPTGRGTTSATAAALKIRAGAHSVAEFASSLAIGDLTGDGRSEVVAGAPDAQVGRSVCGAVAVLRGAASGISPARAQVVSQSSRGVIGICEDGDSWGESLVIGNIMSDKRPELVVGAPVESVGKLNGGGAYTVLRPSASGVTGRASVAVDQNTVNVPGVAEVGDDFALALGLADVNGDGRLDVVAGGDGEKIGTDSAGSVTFAISTATGRPARATSVLTGRSFTPAVDRLARSICGPPAR